MNGSKQTLFSCPWFRLVGRRTDTAEEPFYSLELNDYVHVLALTANDEILLVRQYRPAVGATLLDFPCGHVEDGQTPEEAARHELLEETGYTADKMEYLGTLNPDVGRLSNRLHAFATRGARPVDHPVEREKGVECLTVPRLDIPKMIAGGELSNAFTLAVLALAEHRGWSLLAAR